MKTQTVKNIFIKGYKHTLVVDGFNLISAYDEEGYEIYNPMTLQYIEILWNNGIKPSF